MTERRTVDIQPIAQCDIDSILLYIGLVLKAKNTAVDWYKKFEKALDLLSVQTEIGRAFEDGSLELVQRRSYLFDDWRIIYSYTSTTLTVWRILHTKQDIGRYTLVDF